MTSPLIEEHALLFARYAEEDGVPAVASYGDPADEVRAFAEGAGLVDLSGMLSVLMSGAPAGSFASAAFAGRELAVGECSFEAVLLGDASLASVALLARTGDAEYVCWDLSARSEVLGVWLSFLAAIEQGGTRPFEGLAMEDVAESLVPLLMWGPAAPVVLSDYLGKQQLVERGAINNLMLDRIGCLVASLALDEQPAYLVLVPPAYARVLWRSFLSFTQVMPVGGEALDTALARCLPWYHRVSVAGERVEMGRAELEGCGLVRHDRTFVGARAFGQQ